MNKSYLLEERTAVFGESIILFCKQIAPSSITSSLVNQLVRSATSIGANYMEANGACSKSDFRNKIYICKKEAMETKHWLRMLSAGLPEKREQLREFWREAQELTLIFSKIASSSKNK